MFCHKCGNKVNEGASFCQSCGERLSNISSESKIQGDIPSLMNKKVSMKNVVIAVCLVVAVIFAGKSLFSDRGSGGSEINETATYDQKEQCLYCNGTGYISCVDCSGTGERTGEWRASLNGFEKQTCPTCNGTGQITCSYCSGTGWR